MITDRIPTAHNRMLTTDFIRPFGPLILLFCISDVVAVLIPSATWAEAVDGNETAEMADNPNIENIIIEADKIIFFISPPI
jgi:hypothetical protein